MRGKLTVALTGAGGFLGSAALRAIAASAGVSQVRALFPRPPEPSGLAGNVRAFSGELKDRALCRRFLGKADVVLHLANRGFPLDAVGDPKALMSENLEAAVSLLESMDRQEVRRIVFASSGGAIYGSGRRGAPFREGDPVSPRSWYAAYKLAIEGLLESWAKKTGGEQHTLRISTAFGFPPQGRSRQGFIGIAMRRILDRAPMPLWGTLDVRKDFIYIRDVVGAFEAFALGKKVPGGIYHVGSGRATSLSEVVEALQRVTGSRLRWEKGDSRPGDCAWTALDASKARGATGWHCRYSLEDGIREMWAQCRPASCPPKSGPLERAAA